MFRCALTVLVVLSALAGTGVSAARPRHPPRAPKSQTASELPPGAHMFYPEQVEGGVSGNLPFNNQIRKHTDPLNANGGR